MPITDDAGQVIGFGRTAGPLTDQDRAVVAAFAEYLAEAWASDQSGTPRPEYRPPVDQVDP